MIIITASAHPIIIETLTEKGLDFIYLPEINRDELLEIIPKATGIIVATKINIDNKIIDNAPHLKWIGRLGSGMEHIDVSYAQSKNIQCISSPEGNRNAVAEHALGLLLGLMRNAFKSSNEVKNNFWLREVNRGDELCGKTIGIIGFGNTGSAFAKLLSSFDVNILAYDKYKKGFGNDNIMESSLETVMKKSDVVSFHLPLTKETKHFADKQFFNGLTHQPYLINTSRGSVINTAALIFALEQKIIKGAALDVLENEDLSSFSLTEKRAFEYLTHHEKVIITPHIAGYSFEANYNMSVTLLKKLGIY